MISFESDYTEGAHPKVLAHLAATNLKTVKSYGEMDIANFLMQMAYNTFMNTRMKLIPEQANMDNTTPTSISLITKFTLNIGESTEVEKFHHTSKR